MDSGERVLTDLLGPMGWKQCFSDLASGVWMLGFLLMLINAVFAVDVLLKMAA